MTCEDVDDSSAIVGRHKIALNSSNIRILFTTAQLTPASLCLSNQTIPRPVEETAEMLIEPSECECAGDGGRYIDMYLVSSSGGATTLHISLTGRAAVLPTPWRVWN